MRLLLTTLELLGGIASRRQLIAWGVHPGTIDVAAWYGRHVICVRKGWYASAGEHPEVVRAWRVGGRLSCVSALAFHERTAAPPVLHVEVPANSAHLRDPDRMRSRLSPDSAVVVHWTRYPGPGTRRAVDLEHANAVAEKCGVHSAGVASRQAAAARSSASRIV